MYGMLAFQMFEIDYPLEKEDFAAIPGFGPGAMENWGLITFWFNAQQISILLCHS